MNLFSTEQVSKYHPDKYADQISGAILTECLRQDKGSHVACECLVKDTTVVLAGEITTFANIDYEAIVKRVAAKLGYKVTEIINLIGKQSPEINGAVKDKSDLGAGDQGIMFGYATTATHSRLPLAFEVANSIIKAIEWDVQYKHSILKGDAKTQVTIDLDTDHVTEILISVCHDEGYSTEEIHSYVLGLLATVIPNFHKKFSNTKFIINPAGPWTIGGPMADCGLTGRKIVCDQYGGFCAVGGGAFSGKDPSKVDVSAAYMARYLATMICDEMLPYARDVEVQLGYAIGAKQPMSVSVKVDGKYDENIASMIALSMDLSPQGIIDKLQLLDLDYEKIAEGCHYRKPLKDFIREDK